MPPGVLVWFPLEGRPVVIPDLPRDADAIRFSAWIDRHPEYGELLGRLIDLTEDEERAA